MSNCCYSFELIYTAALEQEQLVCCKSIKKRLTGFIQSPDQQKQSLHNNLLRTNINKLDDARRNLNLIIL